MLQCINNRICHEQSPLIRNLGLHNRQYSHHALSRSDRTFSVCIGHLRRYDAVLPCLHRKYACFNICFLKFERKLWSSVVLNILFLKLVRTPLNVYFTAVKSSFLSLYAHINSDECHA